LTNCCQEEINIDKLAYFDLEYMFLKLRAKSVNNIIDFKYKDPEDDEEYKLRVNLDDVDIERNEKNNPVVWINEENGVGLRLKFPSITETLKYKESDLNQDEVLTRIIKACIEDVFDKEEVYQFDQYTAEQQLEFIDDLEVPVFAKIQEFFDTVPVLKHTIKYKNKAKENKTIVLEGLNDFFTWG
jgi:5-methylcytosine-specific restriction endonuclease McrBC regulatory subunit McrC